MNFFIVDLLALLEAISMRLEVDVFTMIIVAFDCRCVFTSIIVLLSRIVSESDFAIERFTSAE